MFWQVHQNLSFPVHTALVLPGLLAIHLSNGAWIAIFGCIIGECNGDLLLVFLDVFDKICAPGSSAITFSRLL